MDRSFDGSHQHPNPQNGIQDQVNGVDQQEQDLEYLDQPQLEDIDLETSELEQPYNINKDKLSVSVTNHNNNTAANPESMQSELKYGSDLNKGGASPESAKVLVEETQILEKATAEKENEEPVNPNIKTSSIKARSASASASVPLDVSSSLNSNSNLKQEEESQSSTLDTFAVSAAVASVDRNNPACEYYLSFCLSLISLSLLYISLPLLSLFTGFLSQYYLKLATASDVFIKHALEQLQNAKETRKLPKLKDSVAPAMGI
jgi:hypothetical protein